MSTPAADREQPDDRTRLIAWLRQVALFSNDAFLARPAREEYVELTGQEPRI